MLSTFGKTVKTATSDTTRRAWTSSESDVMEKTLIRTMRLYLSRSHAGGGNNVFVCSSILQSW